MKKTLVKYVRNQDGHPIGAVVAVGRDKVGWSLCHRLDRGKFDKNLAVHIAESRAVKGTRVRAPDKVMPEVDAMTQRAEHYFKQ